MKDRDKKETNSNIDKLAPHKESPERAQLTTNQGVPVGDNQNTLKAGSRGPSLLEDFIFREKMMHFDHERIPERVVHARGSGAHGYFQVYESMREFTTADFLQDPAKQTPVFVRFSTVVGFRGSADTVRDVRGFATKFYTDEGVFDLVGNNIPVFFIQDAMKFPDLVHSIKPEPHNEMPQASAAHDNFWDFISLTPEAMHMIMWVISDRALPRSYRMMEGFGVHTFRFINASGNSCFVKFHWKPVLGVHALVWDETQKIAGKDPDFNRRDLWETIEAGTPVEFELGVQIVDEADEHKFDFDLLDATKIIPEELVPVKRIGKMTLNRNPDNFFAETEQVAFHPGHIVPGIDFSNDPLLQGRLFSYLDTQLIRLGGPNFAEIPINRPTCPVHNNQRDGFMRQAINTGRTNYDPNSLGGGCPMQSPEGMRQFASYAEKIDANKVRERSDSFADHFTQATLFWNSQSEAEKQHIVDAFRFELGKVQTMHVRERMIALIANVDQGLAERVAAGIGVQVSNDLAYLEESPSPRPNDKRGAAEPGRSASLSMENTVKDTIRTRKIAVLLEQGFDHHAFKQMRDAIEKEGAMLETVSTTLGPVKSDQGESIKPDKLYVTTASVLYDALFIPGGREHAETLQAEGDAVHFVNEMFRHCKPIGAAGEGVALLKSAQLAGIQLAEESGSNLVNDKGVVTVRDIAADDFTAAYVTAIAQHRHWNREQKKQVPA